MGKEGQPSRIIRTIFVDSFDIVAEKAAQFFVNRIIFPVAERITARVDPQSRTRAVHEVIQARFEGREPKSEAVEHVKYMPGSAVKEILTGARRKGR